MVNFIEASYHMVGNVCVYDEPLKTDWEEWMDAHDGCVVILNDDFDLADERIITVYAFSNDEKYNIDVYMYFKSLSDEEKSGKSILNYSTGGGSITWAR